jgi:DNA-binding IclR family transcriptional regulator
MSYDLRRLRLHGLIERIPKTHRYRPTTLGMRVAFLYSRSYQRIVRPGLSLLCDPTSSDPLQLRRCFDQFQSQLDAYLTQKLAA